jgi:hypothetical protein
LNGIYRLLYCVELDMDMDNGSGCIPFWRINEHYEVYY